MDNKKIIGNNINRHDIKEIITTFIPPALFILPLALFSYTHPEHICDFFFNFFGLLTIQWFIYGKIMETFFDDKISILMNRLHPLINLFLITAYFAVITLLCIVCMLYLNRFILVFASSLGNYIPAVFFWGLFSIPLLKTKEPKDAPVHTDTHQSPKHQKATPTLTSLSHLPTDNTPTSRILCRECGIAVTTWLREPDAQIQLRLSEEKYTDGEPLIPQGIMLDTEIFLKENDYFWGAQNSRIILNHDDLINTIDGGVRNGCCGVDGCDGINIFCINNHPLGTEISDCYQPAFVHMPTEHIILEGRSTEELLPNTPLKKEKAHQSNKIIEKNIRTSSPYQNLDDFDQLTRCKMEAEYFRLALIGGFIDNHPIVIWADKLIENDTACSIIIELSLCGSKPACEVTQLLSTIPGHCDPAYPVNILLAHCHLLATKNKMVINKILSKLGAAALANKVPESYKNDIDWLIELQYLASNEEYATIEQAHGELKQYLASYSKYEKFIPHIG